MSNRDQRSYEERLVEYVENHRVSAELNKDRALVSGSADDLAWAYFLRDVTAFAAERLTKSRRGGQQPQKEKDERTENKEAHPKK